MGQKDHLSRWLTHKLLLSVRPSACALLPMQASPQAVGCLPSTVAEYGVHIQQGDSCDLVEHNLKAACHPLGATLGSLVPSCTLPAKVFFHKAGSGS